MRGRKRADILIAAVILILIGVEVCMEARYSCQELSQVKISDEKLLREMPDVALTDADAALGERVLSAPRVMEALGTEKGVDLAEDEAALLFGNYLPEDAGPGHISIFRNSVICDYLEKENKRVGLTFFQDHEYGPYKTIALYSGGDEPQCKVIYENQAGELKKMKVQRRWFAWLRDRMWED